MNVTHGGRQRHPTQVTHPHRPDRGADARFAVRLRLFFCPGLVGDNSGFEREMSLYCTFSTCCSLLNKERELSKDDEHNLVTG